MEITLEFMTLPQAAIRLGVSDDVLRRKINYGEIPYQMVGQRYILKREDVEAYADVINRPAKQTTTATVSPRFDFPISDKPKPSRPDIPLSHRDMIHRRARRNVLRTWRDTGMSLPQARKWWRILMVMEIAPVVPDDGEEEDEEWLELE